MNTETKESYLRHRIEHFLSTAQIYIIWLKLVQLVNLVVM